jgi:hypothetical protein
MKIDIPVAPILTDVEMAIQGAIIDLKYDNACTIHDSLNGEWTKERLRINNELIDRYEKMIMI